MMEYYKLIAVSIGDLSSSIFFEDNYGLSEFDEANKLKYELEANGLYLSFGENGNGYSSKLKHIHKFTIYRLRTGLASVLNLYTNYYILRR